MFPGQSTGTGGASRDRDEIIFLNNWTAGKGNFSKTELVVWTVGLTTHSNASKWAFPAKSGEWIWHLWSVFDPIRSVSRNGFVPQDQAAPAA